jgi:hypothetical protein
VTDADEVLAQRKSLAERFSVAPVAYSSDGRTVGFAGPIELGVEVGGFAMVDAADGGHLVVQLLMSTHDAVPSGRTHPARRDEFENPVESEEIWKPQISLPQMDCPRSSGPKSKPNSLTSWRTTTRDHRTA